MFYKSFSDSNKNLWNWILLLLTTHFFLSDAFIMQTVVIRMETKCTSRLADFFFFIWGWSGVGAALFDIRQNMKEIWNKFKVLTAKMSAPICISNTPSFNGSRIHSCPSTRSTHFTEPNYCITLICFGVAYQGKNCHSMLRERPSNITNFDLNFTF